MHKSSYLTKIVGTSRLRACLMTVPYHYFISPTIFSIQRCHQLGYSLSKSKLAFRLWHPVLTRFNHDKITSRGFLTTHIIFYALNWGAYGMHHGEWVFTIHTVSSTISSPFIFYIWSIILTCRVLSAPVWTPVSISEYLRRKVLPDLGKEAKAILLDLLGVPSRNLNSP